MTMARRTRAVQDCGGAFDKYRLVPSLARLRTPVFRRTCVQVGPDQFPPLVARYHRAWTRMVRIHQQRHAWPADDCWFCKGW